MDDLEQKIQLLREQYTFDRDKERALLLLKQVREMRVRKDLKNLDGIKILLVELEKQIKERTTLLAWDREMTEEQRKLMFARRDDYIWFVSFFEDPEKVIENITKQVESELSQ